MKKKILALFLAIAMVLSLIGCTQEPTTTEPSTEPSVETTEPAPDAAQIYADACAALGADVTLDVVTTKTTTVGDQTLTVDTTQVLTYAGVGTDAPMIHLQQTVPYWDYDSNGDMKSTDEQYTELYAGGMLYVDLQGKASFSTEMTQEDALARYIPAVLLDVALYEDVTMAENGTETVITFAQSVGGETWAVPEEAELVEATGTATVTGNAIGAMTYTVTYEYGTVTVTQTTESKPRTQAETVTAPESTDGYVPVQSADALYWMLQAEDLKNQVTSGSFMETSSMYCQAAGVVRNQSTAMDFYDVAEDLMAKVEYNVYFMDYANQEDQTYSQEENYQNGKYTYTENDGVPTTTNGLARYLIRDYYKELLNTCVVTPAYWQEVTLEDLGSLYYMEFTFSQEFGNDTQNSICSTLWQDPAFLNSLASNYVTDEVTGYMSIDKYTGLPVAVGYKYQGTHTIDGGDYILTDQADASFILPSFGAYKEVTETLQPESEPEQKATPLFYHVTGENGQEMWLFGTIHIGDERTGYLPQEIYDAFAASDALALECDSETFDKQVEEDEELQEEVSNLYYYGDGTTVADHVDEELYETALKYLKATGNYNMNADYMKAGVWSNSIDNFYLDQGHSLSREQGVEERLTALAKEQGKQILEVESSLFQIKMLTGWSEDLQELLLEEAVEYAGIDNITGTNELYEMWCAGDETTLREYLSDEVDTSEWTEEELAEYETAKPLLDEYNQAMSIDRNDGMLEVAIEYLESGKVVFYAVGLAHLLDSTNGLVDTLREAGYTVELVSFS